MKKSLHTLLTAAMFAAANVSAVPAAAADNGAAVRPEVDPVETVSFGEKNSGKTYETIKESFRDDMWDFSSATTTKPALLYGSPWMFTTTTTSSAADDKEITTTSSEADEKETTTTGTFTTLFEPWMTTTTTTIPQPVYGPPLQDFLGDVNLDNIVDSFDVLAVKKMLIKGVERYSDGYMEAYYADMNNDGKLTLADLVILQKYLLGQVSKQELQKKYGYFYGSHNIEIEKIGDKVTDTATTTGKKPVVTTTTTSKFDPGSDIVISLYGIKPSIDIVREITEDSINKIKDTDFSEEK